MRPYGIIDLHCDTITDIAGEGKAPDPMNNPIHVLTLDAMPEDVRWAELYAVWIPETYTGQDAIAYFEHHMNRYYAEVKHFSDRVMHCETAADLEKAWSLGKRAAFLAIEDGSAVAGDIGRIEVLRKQGVRFITLTWNEENEIGSGNTTDHGLSDFGRRVIPEMERCGIIADVSHLNDRGFADLLEVAGKPFVATHSNARAMCGHLRNLTDDMITEMVKRECLIGLNYSVGFLTDGGIVNGPDDLYRHIEHFLELGAVKNLALGSDFDGTTLPDYLNTPEKVAGLYDYLLGRGLSEDVVKGIYFDNALAFFRKNL